MESEKIKSPKSNRYIYINGDAYNKLLNEGYTQKYLLSLPRIKSNKPMSPKYKKINTNMNNYQTNLLPLPELDNIVLYQLDYKDLYITCLSNKSLYQKCLTDKTLQLKLKAYQLYLQLNKNKKIIFSNVDKLIIDQYNTYKVPNYSDKENIIIIIYSKAIIYKVIATLNELDYKFSGLLFIDDNKWIDFIYSLLQNNTNVKLKNNI